MDSIRLKTKELQSKMYLTQTQTCRLRLIDSDSLTHWTHKIGRLAKDNYEDERDVSKFSHGVNTAIFW